MCLPLNFLHSDLHLRVCFPGYPTYDTETIQSNHYSGHKNQLALFGVKLLTLWLIQEFGEMYWLLEIANEQWVAEPGLYPHLPSPARSFRRELDPLEWHAILLGFPTLQPDWTLVLPTGWALSWFRAFDSAITSFLIMFSCHCGFFSGSSFQLSAVSSGKPFWNDSTKGVSPTSLDSHWSHFLAYFFQWPYSKLSCLFVSTTQNYFSFLLFL